MGKKLKCWEFFRCNETDCPVYQTKDVGCWLVSGTHCRNEIQGKFLEKIEMCLDCAPFRANVDLASFEETLKVVDAQFKAFRQMVDAQGRELEAVSMEMAMGLSEVFEALKALSSGDPDVRIPEASELELISKLKEMVNLTGKNLGEIVDLSHEVAMGLAEHFDTLHRVSKGDLSARVLGSSEVELVDSLKNVTNQMIDSVAREISERKAAERTLLEEKNFSESTISTLPGIFYVFDEEGRFLRWNKNLENVSGYSAREISEMAPIVFFAEEDRDLVTAAIQEVFEKGKSVVEAHLMSAQGRQIPYYLTGLRARIGNGTYLVGMGIDITERRRAAEERASLEAQLQQSQKMEAIGTLAGGVAHDFNNILSVIVGNVELAMDDIAAQSPAQESLKEARRACLRARDLVKQILSFSRQTGRELKPVKIGTLFKESLKLLRSSLPTTIDIRHNISCHSDAVLGDPTQLNRVLLNLCTNAAHAMRERGGTLQVNVEDVELDDEEASAYQGLVPGTYVKLTVTDTGYGMEPTLMERVFDPYFTTKEVGQGTGLGLSVVHGIVKGHGGAITFRSKPEIGTTFDILLPVIETQVRAEEPERFDPLPEGRERILLVDDEKALAGMAKEMLEHLGYQVFAKTSSLEALEAFMSQPDQFDLVITDMTMPGMT
ncbi:MAG: ATP-binding protein, partial [Thermodesulfobacteriota bacterium]|nr:ATP-binding protein [Thermodesulfobacteriota bacterium]